MRNRYVTILFMAAVLVMAVTNFASADTIRGIGIDFVTIGHPGNAADTSGTPGCGAVSYNYRIGKNEITNAQWNAFVTVAGAPTGNSVGGQNPYDESSYYTGIQQPVNNISWFEAAQFCNFLTSGDKSKGVYQFSGSNSNPGDFLGINRDAAISSYGTAYVIPTEDEWYKAAYFKPNGSGYSLYANGTNTAPIVGVQSNYNLAVGAPWITGTGIVEQNGTVDMMGNVWEWLETEINFVRGIRGGSYVSRSYQQFLSSSQNWYAHPITEDTDLGFRVVSIPEPCTLILLGLGAVIVRKR